ncbi:hypothetical protein TNIN_176601 [Trichonephila inaurata madagascariensis]|uniref:Uncharacterized protein n=1 Tax=Trichonephila inaurata madagascariensis TaxID=2747483 RepID=A0A8X6XN08_9ARAC|nr:hypothetical protein TNIN_176601 [Trichonephila inaurata madagascariensis]
MGQDLCRNRKEAIPQNPSKLIKISAQKQTRDVDRQHENPNIQILDSWFKIFYWSIFLLSGVLRIGGRKQRRPFQILAVEIPVEGDGEVKRRFAKLKLKTKGSDGRRKKGDASQRGQRRLNDFRNTGPSIASAGGLLKRVL